MQEFSPCGRIVNAVQKRYLTSFFELGGVAVQLKNQYIPIFKCVYYKTANTDFKQDSPGGGNLPAWFKRSIPLLDHGNYNLHRILFHIPAYRWTGHIAV